MSRPDDDLRGFGRLSWGRDSPEPQPITDAIIPGHTLPCFSYPDWVTRKLLAQGDPWDAANTTAFYGRTHAVAAELPDSPGWESLAAHAIWLHKGQEVVRLPQPVWRALAAVPHADRTLNDTPHCYYVVVEDGLRQSAPRMPGGVVIFAGMYVWRRGATWVAPTFTDNKRRIYLRMYPYRLRASEPEVETSILAMDRIGSNLLRALADHRLSRLDLVAQHDNRPRAARAAAPLRARVRRLALTADPMAVWSPQRVPAVPEPLPPPAEHHPHASPCLHAVRQHLALRWVCEANATDAEREAAREAGRTRGHLVAVHRTVHPFVRGAASLRPRVTEVTLRGAG